MTTTNQAFIRVYRQDAAELGPSGPIIAQAESPRGWAAAASTQLIAAQDLTARRAGQAAASGALLVTSIDVVAPPAGIPRPTSVAPGKRALPTRSDPRPEQLPPRHFDRPATAKKPLSAYIARHQDSVGQTLPDDTSRLCAGTTVASFRWPTVCRILAQQCASQLDSAVDRMLGYTARGGAVIGVLGLFAGSGCTTTALCLGARLASRGCRTVLVDGNFARPRLALCLDVVPTIGWQEVLAIESPLGDAMVHSIEDRLDLLAQSADLADNPRQLVAAPNVSRSTRLLRQTYELALVDLGAFFDRQSQPLALELVRQMAIDAVLAVAGPDETDPRDLAAVGEQFAVCGCELLGLIENRIAKPQSLKFATPHSQS